MRDTESMPSRHLLLGCKLLMPLLLDRYKCLLRFSGTNNAAGGCDFTFHLEAQMFFFPGKFP